MAATFEQTGNLSRELTVQLASGEKVRELNRRFRGLDRPTDVLAFPAAQDASNSPEEYLGDIIISVPQAAEQAGERDHSLQDELTLLAIHGLLHLLGFDHADQAGRREMWAAQNDVLARLGLAPMGASHR